MMTDPIADMLTRIRNATGARKEEVLVPFSNLKLWIASLLVREGYLASVERLTDQFGTLRLLLKYVDGAPSVQHIKRISKPGRRVYHGVNELPRVRSGMGIAVLSTSQGVMTNQEARKRKLGGEVLFEIY